MLGLKSFLDKAFGYTDEVSVLESCRKGKISFHVIIPNLYVDHHATSGAFIAFEFSCYLRNAALRFLEHPWDNEDLMWLFFVRAHEKNVYNR